MLACRLCSGRAAALLDHRSNHRYGGEQSGGTLWRSGSAAFAQGTGGRGHAELVNRCGRSLAVDKRPRARLSNALPNVNLRISSFVVDIVQLRKLRLPHFILQRDAVNAARIVFNSARSASESFM